MDFFIFSLIIFLASLYYLQSWIFNISKRDNTTNGKLHLPPGSLGWPFIGETLEFLRTAKNGAPQKFIADRTKKYSSNVFKTSLFGEPMALLNTVEGNKFLYSKEDKLVKSWMPRNFTKIIDLPDKTTISGETARMKRITLPLLKPDSLKNYVGIMDKATKQHLETYWDSKEVVKVHPLERKYTFGLVCKLLLNIEDPKIIEKLEQPSRDVTPGFLSFPINLPGTKLKRAIKSFKLVKDEMEKLVVQRRIDLLENKVMMSNTPLTNDVLSHLLKEMFKNGEMMKDSDIAKLLDGLLIGAYDNISSTLVSVMFYLADFPEVYDAVLKEQIEIGRGKAPGDLLNWEDIQKMKYSWNVVCEVLRLLPPSIGAYREATTDFVYDGFLIPKGFKIHWNVHATHKNPQYFPEPEKFKPSRFQGDGPVPFSYVPFGGGPRMCPGNEYARVKILVFMHNVVQKFKWEKVFPNEKMKMAPILSPTKGLPIRLYPHKI